MEKYIMLLLLVVGVILLFVGLIGGYTTYATDEPLYFPMYLGFAFIGALLSIIGIGMGTHDDSGGKS